MPIFSHPLNRPPHLQSGNILRRAQLYEEEVRSKRRNIALLQVVKAVSNADENVDVVIRQVMTTSQQTLNCHRVSLFQVCTRELLLIYSDVWSKASDF